MLMGAESTQLDYPDGLKHPLVGRSLLLPYFYQYRPKSLGVFHLFLTREFPPFYQVVCPWHSLLLTVLLISGCLPKAKHLSP